jgi:hypothetical protein
MMTSTEPQLLSFESVLTTNKVAFQLRDIFQSAIDIAMVTGKDLSQVLSDRKFLQKHIEGVQFSVGSNFGIQCTKISSEYCTNVEHANGLKYENHRRTIRVIFDYINTRLLLFADLNNQTDSADVIESAEYATQSKSFKSVKQELIDDIVDLVKADKADLVESTISIFDKHIIIELDDISITVMPKSTPADTHYVVVKTGNSHFVDSSNVYIYSFISALTASLDRICETFERYRLLHDQLAVLYPTCIEVRGSTKINDDIKQFIRSDKTELLYELKQFQPYAKRFFKIDKISSKAYTIEAYEEFADGRKYWSFHKKLTGVNRDIMEFMNLANSVYNVFNV